MTLLTLSASFSGSVIATCVDTLDVSVGSSGSVSITPQMVALNSGTTCPRGYSLDKSEFSCAGKKTSQFSVPPESYLG